MKLLTSLFSFFAISLFLNAMAYADVAVFKKTPKAEIIHAGILTAVNKVPYPNCNQGSFTVSYEVCKKFAIAPLENQLEALKQQFHCKQNPEGIQPHAAVAFAGFYEHEGKDYLVGSKSESVTCTGNPVDLVETQRDYKWGDFSDWQLIYSAATSDLAPGIRGGDQVLDPCFEIDCNLSFQKPVIGPSTTTYKENIVGAVH